MARKKDAEKHEKAMMEFISGGKSGFIVLRLSENDRGMADLDMMFNTTTDSDPVNNLGKAMAEVIKESMPTLIESAQEVAMAKLEQAGYELDQIKEFEKELAKESPSSTYEDDSGLSEFSDFTVPKNVTLH